MGAEYELLLQTPAGAGLGPILGVHRCTYARGENTAGEMTLIIPRDTYDPSRFQPFGRILVQRQIGGTQPYIDLGTPWFIVNGPLPALDSDGREMVSFECLDALGLIVGKRIIPYNEYTSYTQKNAPADDLILALARENFGALATDPLRSLAGACNIASDVSAAPSILKYDMAWRPLLDVMQEIANASANDPTTPVWLGFDIVLADEISGLLEFRTYTGQRGVDHRFPGGNPPLILSPENNNLGSIQTGTYFRESASVVYAAGAATTTVRPSTTAMDEALLALSPFAWMEKFADGSQIQNASALEDLAESELRSSHPVRYLNATLVETERCLRGVHYDFGDQATAYFEGDTYDVCVDKIAVTLEAAPGGGLADSSVVMLTGALRAS